MTTRIRIQNLFVLQCLVDLFLRKSQKYFGLELHEFTMFAQPTNPGYQKSKFPNGKTNFSENQNSRSANICFYNVWSTSFCEKGKKMFTKH